MHWVIQYTTEDYIAMAVFGAIYLGVFGGMALMGCIMKYRSSNPTKE